MLLKERPPRSRPWGPRAAGVLGLAVAVSVACGQVTIELGDSSPGLAEGGAGGQDGAPRDGGQDAASAAPCSSGADCGGSRGLCDPASGTCVGCLSSEDCTSTGWSFCDATRRECVQCLGDWACAAPIGPLTSICDPGTGRCRQTCGAGTGCLFFERCDEARGLCVECTSDDHCFGRRSCVDGRCVECESDADCTSEEPFCDIRGSCAPCTRDAHCATGEVCDGFTRRCGGAR